LILDQSIDQVDIDSLIPYARNPRVGDVSALADSLRINGQYRPLVVRHDTREILAGNHTWKAAKALGWATVAVSWLWEITDEEAARIVLADNRYSDMATYDLDALAALLESLGNFEGTGYTAEVVEDLLASLTASDEPTALTDPDDIPEPPSDPQSRLGDVWSLGPHRLLVGDSTGDLGDLMQGDEAHLVFTDPPWNVNYGAVKKGNAQGYKPRKILNDNQGTAFDEFCEAFSTQLKAYSRPGAAVYLVMSAQEWPVIDKALREAGFHWSSTIIWAKDQLVLSRKDYHTQYEPIWYGWNESAARLTPVEDRKQSDLWAIPRPKRSDLHPTTKPVELVARAISNSTQPGNIVLDAFGGSGSTLIACHQTGRIGRLVELDPIYADVILRRYMEHTGEVPINQDGERFRGPGEDEDAA
jgi:DNA modification methylase